MINEEQTRVIAWVDHDETAIHEVVGRIGALTIIERERRALKDVFRLVPVIVAPEGNLAARARERILHECGRMPDLVLVDLAFGPPESGGVVEVGRQLALQLLTLLHPVPVGIYSRYPCPRPVKRYDLASDGFAVVLENIRSTYEGTIQDDRMTGDQWCRLFNKIIGRSSGGESRLLQNETVTGLSSEATGADEVTPGKTDIGIITVREDEFTAVLSRFQERRTLSRRQHYELAALESKDGQAVTVAMVRCPEQGQGRAQAVARDMIDDLDPKWLILVGIAGGMPDNEFSLGDVVVATRLTDFSVSAALEDKPSEFSVGGGMMHQDVENLVAHLPAFEKNLKGWNKAAAIHQPRPQVTVSQEPTAPEYYGDEEWRNRVIRSLSAAFPASGRKRGPKFVARAVISSNALIKGTDLAREWQQVARHVAAVEMELGGIYMAAWRGGNRSCRVVAIRGLSDIVGYKRSSEWTTYACETAAAFAHALIVSGIMTLRAIGHESADAE